MKFIPVLLLAGGIGLYFSLQELRAEGRESSGMATTYYPSGGIQTETEVDAGVKHGAFRRYRADGTIESAGRYVDGRMDGEWTWYRADGSVDAERLRVYRSGERVDEGR